MRKLTVKVINSTQANRIGVNETLAVVKRETVRHGSEPTRKPKRKPRTNQPAKWFIEFANHVNSFIQRQEQFNQEVRHFMVYVVNRLDNLERRLDNIVQLNNLKE
ncbi:MAG: hypothetical protein LBC33_03095 [Mycoplasmataceae bacterium]|jgi:hypothetical protein|nr:hypothetical protein [Mycoplasmataceae bacterium]